jgi:hypothetical protein
VRISVQTATDVPAHMAGGRLLERG